MAPNSSDYVYSSWGDYENGRNMAVAAARECQFCQIWGLKSDIFDWWMEISAIKEGGGWEGVRRLMANALTNFQIFVGTLSWEAVFLEPT